MSPRCNASPQNVVNAAARAADLHKTTFTDDDKTALTQLSTVALDLKQGTAAAGATGPGSPFAAVQPALESKARLVDSAATLRSALAAYALAKMRGWTDPALQAFLKGLPT